MTTVTSSTSSSDEYQRLVQSVLDLNIKLKDASSKALNLEKENKSLRQQEQEIRDELARVQSRYGKTRKSLLDRLDIAEKRERDMILNESKWRSWIEEEKASLIDNLEDYVVHKEDLGKIRIKVEEEMETKYHVQIENLKKKV